MKKIDTLFEKRFRISLFILFLGLIFAYFFILISPNGMFFISHDFSKNIFSAKSFVSDIRPGERIDFENKNSLIIKAEPVYFSIYSPRNFDKMEVLIRYKNKLSSLTPIIELGLLKDKASNIYDLKPIENSIIEKNMENWYKIPNDDNLLILQRENNYNNDKEFFNDLYKNNLVACNDINDCLLLYNYKYQPNFKLNHFLDQEIIIEQNLRGSHRFFVYFANKDNELEIEFKDINLDSGFDNIEIRIYKENELIKKEVLIDDSNNISNLKLNEALKKSDSKKISLSDYLKQSSLYKIEIITTNDTIINEIKSSSDRIVFINSLWPVSDLINNNYYTKSQVLNAKTYQADSFSTIKFDNNDLALDKSYTNFYIESKNNYLKNIELNKSDIILSVNGYISLDKNTFFSPQINSLDRFIDVNDKSYLIADYDYVNILENEYKEAKIQFDLKGVKRNMGKYNLVFSIPGLELTEEMIEDNHYNKYLEIEAMEIKFTGKSVIQKIKEIL